MPLSNKVHHSCCVRLVALILWSLALGQVAGAFVVTSLSTGQAVGAMAPVGFTSLIPLVIAACI
jgi:hypothetical protein